MQIMLFFLFRNHGRGFNGVHRTYGQKCALFLKSTHICALHTCVTLFRMVLVFTGRSFHQLIALSLNSQSTGWLKRYHLPTGILSNVFQLSFSHCNSEENALTITLHHKWLSDSHLKLLLNFHHWPNHCKYHACSARIKVCCAIFSRRECYSHLPSSKATKKIDFYFFYSTMAVKETVIFTACLSGIKLK